MFNYISIAALANDKITQFGSLGTIKRGGSVIGESYFVVMSKTSKYDEFGHVEDVSNIMISNDNVIKIGDVIGELRLIEVSEYKPDGITLLYYDAKGTVV